MAELEKILSTDRLSTYMRLASGDRHLALRLHAWNTQLAEALFGPIQILEIALRNSIHESLSTGLGPNWYDYCALSETELAMLAEAKRSLTELRKPVSPPRVVAGLSFGFWMSLLAAHHENDLWRPYLCHCFPHGPKPLRRKQIHGPMHQIRLLRNRIAHHEPLLRRPSAHTNLEQDYSMILQVTSWISPTATEWVRADSRFEEVWKNRPF
jgi:hypothetical protein